VPIIRVNKRVFGAFMGQNKDQFPQQKNALRYQLPEAYFSVTAFPGHDVIICTPHEAHHFLLKRIIAIPPVYNTLWRIRG